MGELVWSTTFDLSRDPDGSRSFGTTIATDLGQLSLVCDLSDYARHLGLGSDIASRGYTVYCVSEDPVAVPLTSRLPTSGDGPMTDGYRVFLDTEELVFLRGSV